MAQRESVRYCGRDMPVRDVMNVEGKRYLVLERIGHCGRQRLWVYQPWRHSGGDFRQILVLPRDTASRHHLRVLQRLSQGNPNLPTILECCPRKNEMLVITDWVRGNDLDAYLTTVQKQHRDWPSPIEVMRLYRGLAHGLRQMHRHRGVLHRDIKPANLVLAREPNRLVMIDFGSAWTVETAYQRVIGDGISEKYAAPEQQTDPPNADSRSDQFAASVVAYRMLTGKLPYAEMGGSAGLPRHRSTYERRYKPPSARCPVRKQIPRRIWALIDEIVGTGLALAPASRFQGGNDWLEALEDLHCEMRRRVRFNLFDNILMRVFAGRGTDVR
jgi:serine/threonine protein kinase